MNAKIHSPGQTRNNTILYKLGHVRAHPELRDYSFPGESPASLSLSFSQPLSAFGAVSAYSAEPSTTASLGKAYA